MIDHEVRHVEGETAHLTSRRDFLRRGLALGAGALGAGLLANNGSPAAVAAESSSALTKGDAAILRFLAALEILEADLWQQYNELGGIQDREVPGGSGNRPTPRPWKRWMTTCLSTSTTIPITSSATSSSSTLTWTPKVQNQSIWIGSARCQAVKLPAPGRHRTAHQPHETHRGHKLVHSLPQRHEEPRSAIQ